VATKVVWRENVEIVAEKELLSYLRDLRRNSWYREVGAYSEYIMLLACIIGQMRNIFFKGTSSF
jgi:hypothetical protein